MDLGPKHVRMMSAIVCWAKNKKHVSTNQRASVYARKRGISNPQSQCFSKVTSEVGWGAALDSAHRMARFCLFSPLGMVSG